MTIPAAPDASPGAKGASNINSILYSDIKKAALEATGKTPCLWQMDATRIHLSGQDAIVIARTAPGKTLPIRMILHADKDRCALIISPLKALQEQLKTQFESKGVTTALVTAETANKSLFKACPPSYCPRNGLTLLIGYRRLSIPRRYYLARVCDLRSSIQYTLEVGTVNPKPQEHYCG